jgi:hypothetical protein
MKKFNLAVLAFLFCSLSTLAQGIGGKAGTGGNAGFGGGATVGGSVSVANHGCASLTSTTGNCTGTYTFTCANGAATCALTNTVVRATGDSMAVIATFCATSGCVALPGTCAVAASDGTNTYSPVTAANSDTGVGIFPLVAKNATAGTYTITLSLTGVGCTGQSFNYVRFYWIDLAGANTTSSVDASVSNNATFSGSTFSLASAGNVSYSGEIAIGVVYTNQSIISFYSPFFQLDQVIASTDADATQTHPTSGAGITLAGNLTGTGVTNASLFSVHP